MQEVVRLLPRQDPKVKTSIEEMDSSPFTHAAGYNYDPYADWGRHIGSKIVVGSMCVLSMLGSVTIVATFVAWKEIRTTSRKILVFLSASDFLIASSNLFGILIESQHRSKVLANSICKVQSFFTNSVSVSSFMWTLTLAIYLYLAIVKNNQSLGRNLLPIFHIINWFLGPVINGIALSQKMLGRAAGPVGGGWCWINHNVSKDTSTHYVISSREIMWIVIDAKAIELIVYPTAFVLYACIKYKLHAELKCSRERTIEKDVLESAKLADRKLIFMPLLLFLGRFWGILRCCLAFSGHTSKSLHPGDKALQVLQGVGDSSQGFLNCIFFCALNLKVYNNIKAAILRHICCQRNDVNDNVQKTGTWSQSTATQNITFSSWMATSHGNKQPLLSSVTLEKSYGTKGD